MPCRGKRRLLLNDSTHSSGGSPDNLKCMCRRPAAFPEGSVRSTSRSTIVTSAKSAMRLSIAKEAGIVVRRLEASHQQRYAVRRLTIERDVRRVPGSNAEQERTEVAPELRGGFLVGACGGVQERRGALLACSRALTAATAPQSIEAADGNSGEHEAMTDIAVPR